MPQKPRSQKVWMLRFTPKVPLRKKLSKQLKVNSAFEQIEVAKRKWKISSLYEAMLNRGVYRFSRSRKKNCDIHFFDKDNQIFARLEIRDWMVTLHIERAEFREGAD